MADAPVSGEALFRSPASFLALGAGSGLAPKAPGTFGTLAAIPLACLMPADPLAQIAIVALLFAIGVWCCGRCAEELGVHDHGAIVWDEIVGYLLAMVAVPRTLGFVVLGFALFRLFDILKPWPVGAIDRRVHGGLGIMLDDVVAALFVVAILQLLLAGGWLGASPGFGSGPA
mgnify:CR=1 FL=1